MHGGDIYRQAVSHDFSVNVNPLGVPERVRTALQAAIGRVEEYPDPQHEKLVHALSETLGVSGDRLLIGNGASELIMAICHAVRPESAMITAPSFSGYRAALHAVLPDSRIFRYDLCGEHAFLPDEGLIAAVLEKKPELLILTDPNNPNGLLVPSELLARLLDACEQTGTLLLLDACFMELAVRDGDMPCLVLRDFPSRAPWIELRAFTKSFAIPGVRLGYAVCSGRALADRVRRQLPEWNLSVLAQETGLAVMGTPSGKWDRKQFIEETRLIIDSEKEKIYQELTKMESGDFVIYPSKANFLLLRTKLPLYDKLLEKGILIRDCSNYPGLDPGYYRIAVRGPEENQKLLQAVSDLYRS